MLKRILGVSLDEQQHRTIKLGDLRSGNDRLLILDLQIPSGELDLKKELVTFEIEWIPTQSDKEKIQEKSSFNVLYTNNEELLASENQEVLDNVAILETALIREKAIQLAESAGQNRLAEEIKQRLKLFKAGKPYHQTQ